jgi:hypothetical protein
MVALRQFPMQQSVSDVHAQLPVGQRLLKPTEHPSLKGSWHVLPESPKPPPRPPPSSPPFEPLQLPVQQSLLSLQGSFVKPQQFTPRSEQTEPFAP